MSAAAELVAGLPFNQRIGVLAEEDGRLALPDDATLTNHVEDVDAIGARLVAEGKTVVDVAVALTDAEGTEVATMTVHWHLRGGG